MYGSKIWQINTSLERKLLATGIDFLRRYARKSKIERIPNEQTRTVKIVSNYHRGNSKKATSMVGTCQQNG